MHARLDSIRGVGTQPLEMGRQNEKLILIQHLPSGVMVQLVLPLVDLIGEAARLSLDLLANLQALKSEFRQITPHIL